jgi:hypothetical protein
MLYIFSYLLILCNTCFSLRMPGYEKFEHYNQKPPAINLENRQYNFLAMPNQAYIHYNEAHIRNRMSGNNAIPLLHNEYPDQSFVGISSRNINIFNRWLDQNILLAVANPNIFEMMDMALDREERGVPINFDGWPPNNEQFKAGGYKMPLAKALYKIKTLNPQPNYLWIINQNQRHAAREIVVHFNLFRRTSKNMRDIQTNSYPFPGQETIKSLINQQTEDAYQNNLLNFHHNPSSATVVSYISSQQRR